jgi:hypothetical protein
MKEFRELVAALCHEQWSGWMLYLFGKSQRKSDGSYVIPPEFADRWMRQQTTAYDNLPENEKKSDRVEADKFIALFSKNSHPKELDAERYEKLKHLAPGAIAKLKLKSIGDEKLFDSLIDELPRKEENA